MAIVNQRVCDLPPCAQPITPNTEVTFVMPENSEGEPDAARRAEFHTPKCARTFLRGISQTEKDARLTKLIADTTDNAANKDKLKGLKAKLSGKPAVVYPTAPAA